MTGVAEGVTFWGFHVSMILASEEAGQELEEAKEAEAV